MPVAGQVRLRAHQFGRQAAVGTPVAAKRRYPFSGTPAVDLQWTDPDGDFGALDPVPPPTRGAGAFTAGLTAPTLFYNDLPLHLAGIFGQGVTPSGGAWTFTPTSLTPGAFDYFTYQFGDDVTTDYFQMFDGNETQLVINSPETGGGALSSSMTWRFGQVRSTGSTDSPVTGTVPTTGLSIDTAGTPVYLKDCSVFIDSTAGGIGTTQIVNGVHNFTMTITQEVDEKKFANGTQVFGADDIGRGPRTIELAIQFAKTADTVGTGSEADAWFSDTAVNRFVRIAFASTVTPNAWTISLPLRYYTRDDGAINNNSTVTLTGHSYYDPTLTYPISTTVTNTLASGGL
jgi:hypothetical protein